MKKGYIFIKHDPKWGGGVRVVRGGEEGSADEQDGGFSAGDDMGGGAANEAVIDPAVAVGAEDDEVATDFIGFFKDPGGGSAYGGDGGGGTVVGPGQTVSFRHVFLSQRQVAFAFGHGKNDEREAEGVGQFGGFVQGARGGG